MDAATVTLLVSILLAVIFNGVLQQKRYRELQNMAPEAIEEPDYVSKFESLAGLSLIHI